MAVENGIKSIAFPAISTGAYRFPIAIAAKIATGTAKEFLLKEPAIEKVVFVCFNKELYNSYINL